jgi:hypothetical protein
MAVEGTTRKGASARRSPYHEETVLITAAQASYDVQHKARVRKYAILMSFRIPALVLAAIVYSATTTWWIPLLIIAASIPLPWMAVLIANDRPPRTAEEINRYQYGDQAQQPAIAPSRRDVIEG